jgi:hypothetical protein
MYAPRWRIIFADLIGKLDMLRVATEKRIAAVCPD